MRTSRLLAKALVATLLVMALGGCALLGSLFGKKTAAKKVEPTVPVIVRPVIVAEKGAEEMQKAIALLEEKNFLQAEANFEEIIKVRPDIPEAHFNLAWVKQQLGKHVEVASNIANGLKLKPDEVAAFVVQALSERELGQFTAAEATLKAGIALGKNDDRLFLNLGILYDLYLNRSFEALEYYRRYQELQPAPNQKVAGWIVAIERIKAAKEAKEAAAAKAVEEAKAAAEAREAAGLPPPEAVEEKPAPPPPPPEPQKAKKGKKGK